MPTIAIIVESPAVLEFTYREGLKNILQDAKIPLQDCRIFTAVRTKYLDDGIEEWIDSGKKKAGEDYILHAGKWVKPFIKDDVENLISQLAETKPDVIIASGDISLWSLLALDSVAKWRGSQLSYKTEAFSCPLIPIYAIDTIFRQWSFRAITKLDCARAYREITNPIRQTPLKKETIKPTREQVFSFLASLKEKLDAGPTELVLDLEIKRHTILCVGLGLSENEAFCLPFWHEISPQETFPNLSSRQDYLHFANYLKNPQKQFTCRYWDFETELFIIMSLRDCLIHPNMRLINQNINFDLQFITTYWLCLPTAHFDTMVAQHVMLPGTPKSLDYLHSIYGDEYVFWKDDNKFYKDTEKVHYPSLWSYNCKDCFTTFEIKKKQLESLKQSGLEKQFSLQMRKLNHFCKVMFRGVPINQSLRVSYMNELLSLISYNNWEISYIVNFDLNTASPQQLCNLFYTKLKTPVIKSPKTKRPTVDEDALKEIGTRDPIFREITERINLVRSYSTGLIICRSGLSQFSNRLHCQYNTSGTETFRCSSSKNVWDQGANAQNLTKGKKIL
jgi:3'-5' exonuclease